MNNKLAEFIKEARKRGFGDLKIREVLLTHGWPKDPVEEALLSADSSSGYKCKNQVTLFLDDDLIKALEKRGKKNMFTLSEQAEDILRRSCISQINKGKSNLADSKFDDTLISIFSRRKMTKKS